MNPTKQQRDRHCVWEIADYGKKPTFSSFLPGIAGIRGIPIWCYYVNRGQGVVSFGVENKDKAIMEFYPAHTAYQNVKRTGFRTFLKKDGQFWEPFAEETVRHRMEIGKNSLLLEEENEAAGLRTVVRYFILPEETVGALVRCVTVTNTGKRAARTELLDGMPALIPYGVDMDSCKNMTQTAKAWMQAEQTPDGIAYYRVRASMADSASVQEVEGGNFSLGMDAAGNRLAAIVDAETVFGYDTSLSSPVVFKEGGLLAVTAKTQRRLNQFPCSFYGMEKLLEAGASMHLYELIGQVENQEILHTFAEKKPDAEYLQKKQRRAEELTDEIGSRMAVHTADPVFDAYCSYTFLDNVLRGGLPIRLPGDKVFYVYSRKHGDLERDYNFFAMLPEFYSQGNGNYRDVNQNRRSDNFFAPFVGDFNIKTFYSLLQPDGYNPLGVEKITYALERDGKQIVFTPGSLQRELEKRTDLTEAEKNAAFEEMLQEARPLVNGKFGEGYWSDHWTYNLDLIENYLQIFPEKEEALLFEDSCTWFRPEAGVRRRARRYEKTKNGIRQYHAVEGGLAAKDGCENELLLCDRYGTGRVIFATLLEKLVVLSATKFAALDAYGMGIEMEGGKPGWYDALNGLPGLLGSSVTELCELARNLEFTAAMLEKYQRPVALLEEAAELFEALEAIAVAQREEVLAAGEAMNFWNGINDAREAYREKIYGGVSGARREISAKRLAAALREWLTLVDCGIQKAAATQNGICPAYFYYEVTEYTEDAEGIHPLHVAQRSLPLFLEGPVRWLKLPFTGEEKRALYEKVKESALFDRTLSMYKVNAPLAGSSYELGRARAFTPGWLENESIWLHMEYKYLLELLKSGLYAEFFADFHQMGVPFLDPETYGRSVYENSSFLASSANPDPAVWGRGFVARLSGSTAEFIQMWTLMFFGKQPFTWENGSLCLTLTPAVPAWLIPEDGRITARFLEHTTVTYQFAEKRDYIPGSYAVRAVTLVRADGTTKTIEGGTVCGQAAEDVRSGQVTGLQLQIG